MLEAKSYFCLENGMYSLENFITHAATASYFSASTPDPFRSRLSKSAVEMTLREGFLTHLKVNWASWPWPTLLVLASLTSISPHSLCPCHICLLAVPPLAISKCMHSRAFELLLSLPKTTFLKTLVCLASSHLSGFCSDVTSKRPWLDYSIYYSTLHHWLTTHFHFL